MGFKPLSCVFGKFTIPQRYILVIMMQLGLWNAYHLRVVLNLAMTEMQSPKNHSAKVDACPQYTFEEVKAIKGGRFKWPNDIEAWVLNAFYIGYLFSHIPGGWLADKFGARHVMGTCMITSSIITLIFPVAIQKAGYWAAILLRAIMGLAQGPLFPAISSFIQCWVPAKERAFLGGIAYGGGNLGTVTGSLFTGLIIKSTGSWVVPFYIWGLCALVWYIFYLFMVFSEPQTHPFITEKEVEYLDKYIQKRKKVKVPLLKIIKCIPNYALLAGQFGHDYLFFSILTDLPKYLKEILKMNIKSNAIFTSIPFIFIWVSSILSAYLADWIVNKGYLSVVNTRRLYTAFSAIIPSILLVVTVYIGCDRLGAISLYTLAMFLHGPFYSGMKVNVNDLTVHYGGFIMAIVNGLGAIAGIVGPYIVGALTPNESLEEWHLVFWIMLGVMVVTTFIYCAFTSGERQEWDYPEDEEEKAATSNETK